MMASLEKSIDVNVPASVAYAQLNRYEEYPRFMEGVQEVQATDPTHLHWRCITDGVLREWDSEITAQIPDQLIAWRNITHHQNIGQVQLQALADGQTRLTLSMEYDPQAAPEQTAEVEARTAQRIEGDLQRFKTLMESQMSGAADRAGAQKDASDTWLPRLMEVWEEPLTAMRRMSREVDGIFERFLGRPLGIPLWGQPGQPGQSGTWSPPVEVARRENQLIISADLPGISREAVHVEIRDDKLTIEGDRQAQAEGGDMEYRRTERTYGHFYRMIPLPAGVDPNSASASMHDGVLEITLPVTPQQRQGRRLDIQSHQGS